MKRYTGKIYLTTVITLTLSAIFITAGWKSSNIAYSKDNCEVNIDSIIHQKNIKGNRNSSNRLNSTALSLHRKKNYCEAVKIWKSAADADPSWWKPHFNIACAYSLMHDDKFPFIFLENALKRDRKVVINLIKSDGDLKYFRSTKGYSELLSIYDKREFICSYKYATGTLDSIYYDVEGTSNTSIRILTGGGEMDFLYFARYDMDIDEYLKENNIADYSEGPPTAKKEWVGRKFEVCYRMKTVTETTGRGLETFSAEVLTGINILPE